MLDISAYHNLNTESVLDLSSVVQNATFKALLAAAYFEQQQLMLSLDPSDPSFAMNYAINQKKLQDLNELNLWIKSVEARLTEFEKTGELPDAQELTSADDF